jgi:hypothetical protein
LVASDEVADDEEAQPPKPKVRKISLELLGKYPWLEDELRDAPSSTFGKGSEAKARPSFTEEKELASIEEEEQPPEEIAAAAVWKVLEEKRHLMYEALPDLGDNFHVVVRGGTWTAARKGKAYYVICGQARGGTPKELCRLYTLNIMSSYDASLHSETIAAAFATEWCRIMEYFYSRWMSQELWEYKFSDEDVESYRPSEELYDIVEKLEVESPTMLRAMELIHLRPRNPILGASRSSSA